MFPVNKMKLTIKTPVLTLIIISLLPSAGFCSDGGSHSLIGNIAVAITAAAGMGLLMKLLRQPVIFGQLLAGLLIGPVGLGLITDHAQIVTIAEIGLILLLFMIGLEIDLHKMLSAGKMVLLPGLLQFPICAGLAYAAFGLLEGAGISLGGGYARLYFSVAVALSSTMIVIKLLYDKFELDTLAGRITVGILIFQDIWAIIVLAIQPNLADPRLAGMIKTFMAGALLVTAAMVVSKYVLPRIFRLVAKVPELMLVLSLGWCFLVALVAARPEVGLSMEMGALIAGVSLATFPYNLDVIAKVVSIRDFFITLFFVALGMQIPMPDRGMMLAAGAAAAVALLVRVPGIFGVLYPLRAGHRVSLLTTINLSQVSEFSLVILTLGAGFGHIGGETVTTGIWVFSILAVLSTYLVNYSHQLQSSGARLLTLAGLKDIGSQEEKALHGSAKPVALLGFYRTASAMVADLAARSPETLAHLKVVDFNPVVKKKLDVMGVACVYGDISHPDTLKHAHLEESKVFICTLPDHIIKGSTNLRLLKSLKSMFPGAAFVMTAENPAAAAELYGDGADYVLQPSALSGEAAARIAEHALDGSLAARREEAVAALSSRKEILQ